MFTRISLPSLLVTLSLTACATSNKQSSPEEISPATPVETTEVYEEAEGKPALAQVTMDAKKKDEAYAPAPAAEPARQQNFDDNLSVADAPELDYGVATSSASTGAGRDMPMPTATPMAPFPRGRRLQQGPRRAR
jgi:hypothetical protein